MAGLSGTGRVGDDLYLAAHHELTGKPHLQPRALGIGLAGGLLAELMLAGAIRLARGQVLADGSPPPGDDLARSVLSLVASEVFSARLTRKSDITGAGGSTRRSAAEPGSRHVPG